MGLGEPNIKRALKWVVDRLAANPRRSRSELIDEASREFELTPLEEDFLYRKLTEAETKGGGTE